MEDAQTEVCVTEIQSYAGVRRPSANSMPSSAIVASVVTNWRSPPASAPSRSFISKSAGGNAQSLNGLPLRSAPGLFYTAAT